MFKKKKKKNIKIIILSIVLVIILLIASFNLNRKYLILEKPFKDISTHISKLLVEPITLFSKEKKQTKLKVILFKNIKMNH